MPSNFARSFATLGFFASFASFLYHAGIKSIAWDFPEPIFILLSEASCREWRGFGSAFSLLSAEKDGREVMVASVSGGVCRCVVGWSLGKRRIEKRRKDLSVKVYLQRLSIVVNHGLSQQPEKDSMNVVMDLGTTPCSVRSSEMVVQWHKSHSS